MDQSMVRRLGAEFLGTFILVLGGCGSAVFAAKFFVVNDRPVVDTVGVVNLGIGFVGVSLAFGLTVLAGAYGLGHISGGHFNPAVTVGLATAKRFAWKDAPAYIVTQVIAAVVAAGTVWVVAINQRGMTKDALAGGGLASNGYGDHSPGLYNVTAGLIIEIVLTAIFVIVILGITDRRAPKGFAAMAIGLALTLIHLVSIPVTNTSVNPARSTGPAIITALGGESWPIEQLWLFWVAPVIGGLLGAVIYGFVGREVGGAPGEDTGVEAA
ncbi:MAG: aquaporin Z [Acidimicrobiales bacterium]|jgi:aquaporin Z|nr:aquaporin Z [Acidimicrobiales bacterium]